MFLLGHWLLQRFHLLVLDLLHLHLHLHHLDLDHLLHLHPAVPQDLETIVALLLHPHHLDPDLLHLHLLPAAQLDAQSKS